MKIPKYVSPSAFKLGCDDQVEYYKRYLADVDCYRTETWTSKPMAAGSGFDLLVKDRFARELSFDNIPSLDRLFEDGIVAQYRDYGRLAGEDCMKLYEGSGALFDLVEDMKLSSMEPRFEFSVAGMVDGEVPIFGKPDAFFLTQDGVPLILDFKVNGYGGKGGVSPIKGFRIARDRTGRRTRSGDPYIEMHGTRVAFPLGLESVRKDWATQLTMYAWMIMGTTDVAVIGAIEQILWNEGSEEVVSGRYLVGEHFTRDLAERLKVFWARIMSGKFLSEQVGGQRRQEELDRGFDPTDMRSIGGPGETRLRDR